MREISLRFIDFAVLCWKGLFCGDEYICQQCNSLGVDVCIAAFHAAGLGIAERLNYIKKVKPLSCLILGAEKYAPWMQA